MNKTTIYLPDELQRSLRSIATRTRRSQAGLIREAVEQYVATAEAPTLTSLGAGDDPTLTSADYEAWLRERWSDRDHD